jgi:hypothetical protein
MVVLKGRITALIALMIIIIPLDSAGIPNVTINSPANGSISTTNNITINGTAAGPDVRWLQTSDTDFNSGTSDNINIISENLSLLRLKPYDDFDDSMINTQKWAVWSYGGFYNEELNGMLVQDGVGNTDMEWVPRAIAESTATYNSAFADLKAYAASGDFAITIKLVQDEANAVGIGVKRDPSYNPDIRYIGYIMQSGVESQEILGSAEEVLHTYGLVSAGGSVQAYIDGIPFKTYSISLVTPKIQLNTTARTWGHSASAGWDTVRTSPNIFSLSGNYTSGINDTRALNPVLTKASWHSDVPAGTNLSVQIRSADDIDMTTPTSWETMKNGQTTNLPALKRFLQYRVLMSSTAGMVTPVLQDIELEYHIPIQKVELSIDNQASWSLATGKEQWHVTLLLPENATTVLVRATDETGDTKIESLAINVDTTPPNGRILLNWADDFTESRDVTVVCQVTDNYGLKSILLSERPDLLDASWQDYHQILMTNLSAGDGVKTVYAKFKDQNGWESAVMNDSILLDTSIPTGSVSINGGSEYTNKTNVSLALNAKDSTYVKEMMISNDVDFSGALWAPYNSTIVWQLNGGDGKHIVYVKFQDGAEHESLVVNNSIILDTIAPSIKTKINSEAIYTNSTTITLSLIATDNYRLETVDISEDPLFSGSLQERYISTINYSLSPIDGLKTVYIRATDAAGNTGPANITRIILDTTQPVSSLSQLPPDTENSSITVGWNGTDQISGIKWFDLQYKDGNGPWTDWLQHSTRSSSIFSVQPGHNYSFRVRALDNAGNQQDYPLEAGTTIVVRQKYLPEISIISSKESSPVSGTIVFKGRANHPDNRRQVIKVETNVDDGEWKPANGTLTWKVSIDTRKLSEGSHSFHARAFDGEKYSNEAVSNFTVANVKTGIEQQIPFMLGIVIVLAVIGGVFVAYRKRTRLSKAGLTEKHDETVQPAGAIDSSPPTPTLSPSILEQKEATDRAEKEAKRKENIIRMIEEPIPQREKNEAEIKADEEAARTAAILKALSSLPRGLPSSLWGIEMEDLANKVTQAQRRWSPEGDIIINIDNHWYYGDERNLGLFMQKFGK